MNPDSEVERYCQMVLADTTLKPALEKHCSVEMPLIIPQRKLAGSKLESLGGYLGIPLREMRLGQGHPPLIVDEFLGDKAKSGDEVALILDSGSQGFWVIDFTEGQDGQSITAQSTLGTYMGDYELVCGKRGGPTFTIRIPQQWRNFEGADELLSHGPKIEKGQGLQCLIVGNPFLQAMALTFDVSRMAAVLSHLDIDGNRCETYQGPKSIVSKQQSSLAAQPANLKHNHLPIKDGKLDVPSLAQTSLSTSAPEKDKTPIATDVTLDLRLMTYPNAPTGSLLSVETRKATDLIMPCLDVVVTNAQGKKVYMSQIFDTGSGVNLLMDIDMSSTEVCPSGTCFCENGGLVGQAFGKNSLASANSGSCGVCSNPVTGSKQGGGTVCNSYCCTPDGVSCDNQMPCSVFFCTGVVSYEPKFVSMSFPSENTGKTNKVHLSNVPRVFAGSAQPTCVPGVNTGLFGAWFWDAPLVGSSGKNSSTQAAGIPYYLLGALGQIGGKYENYTLKFWRSDLKKAKQSVVLGQQRIKNNPNVPTKPWWEDQPIPPADAPTASPSLPPTEAPSEPPSVAPGAPSPTAAPSAPPPTAAPSAAPSPAQLSPAMSPAQPSPSTWPLAPGAPVPSPAFLVPPPSSSYENRRESWDISEGAAYNQNRDGGVQQVVIIETDWGNETMRQKKGNANPNRRSAREADSDDAIPRGGLLKDSDYAAPRKGLLKDSDDTIPAASVALHDSASAAKPPSRDWVLRGLAIAGVVILGIILILAVGRYRTQGTNDYDSAYVVNGEVPGEASLQT